MSAETKRPIEEIFQAGRQLDVALGQAVREALLLHKRLGLPIAVWRDDKVVWVPPEEIEIPEEVTA